MLGFYSVRKLLDAFQPPPNMAFQLTVTTSPFFGDHYYDLIGRVKYNFIKLAFVSAGYRHEEISIDQSDIKLNVRFSGPQVEVGFQF